MMAHPRQPVPLPAGRWSGGGIRTWFDHIVRDEAPIEEMQLHSEQVDGVDVRMLKKLRETPGPGV